MFAYRYRPYRRREPVAPAAVLLAGLIVLASLGTTFGGVLVGCAMVTWAVAQMAPALVGVKPPPGSPGSG